MLPAHITLKLQQECTDSNPAMAIFTVWARHKMRRRKQNAVTMRVLVKRMQREGFTYSEAAYADVLRFLNNIGIGELILTHDQSIVSLRNIEYPLYEIGQAATTSHSMPRRNLETEALLIKRQTIPIVKARLPDVDAIALSLRVKLKSRAVLLPVPSDLTGEEITELLRKLHN